MPRNDAALRVVSAFIKIHIILLDETPAYPTAGFPSRLEAAVGAHYIEFITSGTRLDRVIVAFHRERLGSEHVNAISGLHCEVGPPARVADQ